MRRIKRIMGILLSGILLMGAFQLLPMDIDGKGVVIAAALSGDNSLSSLSISPGTLSPAFQYNVVNYTASVGADVTSIEVNAKLSNETATIESVSGNTDLKAGENLISVVVKAQNGTPATYKIVVTKEAGGETQPADGEAAQAEDGEAAQPEDGAAPEDGANAGGITIDGHPFDLSPTIAPDLVPQDFTKTTVTCQGKEVEGLAFDKGELTLVYLTTPSADVKNTLAVYDEAVGIYPFRKIMYDETNYLIVLNPPAESGLPQEYVQAKQKVGEFQDVPVFTAGNGAADTQAAGAEGAEEGTDAAGAGEGAEFALVYGVSSHGNKGWYQYDTVESTFQRYVPAEAKTETDLPIEYPQEEVSEPGAEMQSLQNAYTDMEKQYNAQKDLYRKTTAVMSFVIAVLLVIVVNLLLRGRRNEEDEWEEDDYEELSEKVRQQVKNVRRTRRTGNGQAQEGDDDGSDLWEGDAASQSILRQRTKIIPPLGKELEDDVKTAPEKKGKKVPEPGIERLLKTGAEKKLDPVAGGKVKPAAGAKAKPVAEPKVKPTAESRMKPAAEPKPEPEREYEDFEVIDLEDL